jgi:glutamate-1-semialdehyde 2,1-aminomutase
VIGGGLPAAAYGGRADIMSSVAPLGPVYQAGTLSGNPLAVAAGIATLRILRDDPGIYGRLERRAAQLCEGVAEAARNLQKPLTVNRVGSMFTFFFAPGPVTDYESAKRSDTSAFARFFRAMLERNVYLPPSQFEAAFLSDAHTDRDIAETIRAAGEAIAEAY